MINNNIQLTVYSFVLREFKIKIKLKLIINMFKIIILTKCILVTVCYINL